jgi:hypothetical protein
MRGVNSILIAASKMASLNRLVLIGCLGFCLLQAGPAGLAGELPKVRVAPGKPTFVTSEGKPYSPLGVTYYRPGLGWAPQVWKQWDLEVTRRDFQRMKEAGVNCARVFLSYGSFMPQADKLDTNALAKLDAFLALGEANGIYIHPTGLDHWEGVPEWAKGDRYAEERLLQAQEFFWRELAARYRGRNVIFAYDLLNEPAIGWDGRALRARWNQWLEKRHPNAESLARHWGTNAESLHLGQVELPIPRTTTPAVRLQDYQDFREQVADEWIQRQVRAIKSADPEALVTVGYIQWSVPALLPGIQHYAAFRPDHQASMLDFLEVHFYPLANGFYEYTGPEAEWQNLAYLESVVREVAQFGKPVVLAEFGWCGGGKLTIDGGRHPAVTEENQARWCVEAIETTRGLATGWLNWGFYDHPQAGDVSQLTGLLTTNGVPKAWGREFKRISEGLYDRPFQPADLSSRPALEWDRLRVDLPAAAAFRERYLQSFRKTRESQSPPK